MMAVSYSQDVHYEENGEWIDIDSPAFESSGNILLPIRAIAEVLNYKVV